MSPHPSDPCNTGKPPTCRPGCPYKQRFDGYVLQKNAIRTETAGMVAQWRCGWNIKPGRPGGHPLDYEACAFHE